MKKKKKKTKLKIGNLFLMLCLLAIFGLIIYYFFFKTENSDIKTNIGNITEKLENKEKEYTLSLAMVGDHLIHNGVYVEANKNAKGNGYDFKTMVTYIKEEIAKYDLAYYNQETILGGSELGLSSYPQFLSPYEAGDAMIDAGFNIVSLASNHTLDRYWSSAGSKAIENSYNYWNKKEGVLFAGSYPSLEEKNKPNIKEKNNITYTMLNYTYGTNGVPIPSEGEYLVNVWPTDLDINDPARDTKYQAYKEQVKKDINAVRDKVDVLMVAMHWGVEYTHVPTEYQEDAAKFLADMDVDIVIGAHPHVIQPITWIDDTLVYYSLGNFLSAQEISDYYNKMVGLLGSVKITKTVNKDSADIKIESTENQLIYTYHNGYNYNNYKVIPFSNSDISKYLTNYKEVYNHYKKIITDYDDSFIIKPLSEV